MALLVGLQLPSGINSATSEGSIRTSRYWMDYTYFWRPHAFRRAARTTRTYFDGEHRGLTQGVLQHNSARVGDEHYDSDSTRRAGLELTAIIRELRK